MRPSGLLCRSLVVSLFFLFRLRAVAFEVKTKRVTKGAEDYGIADNR